MVFADFEKTTLKVLFVLQKTFFYNHFSCAAKTATSRRCGIARGVPGPHLRVNFCSTFTESRCHRCFLFFAAKKCRVTEPLPSSREFSPFERSSYFHWFLTVFENMKKRNFCLLHKNLVFYSHLFIGFQKMLGPGRVSVAGDFWQFEKYNIFPMVFADFEKKNKLESFVRGAKNLFFTTIFHWPPKWLRAAVVHAGPDLRVNF